MSRSESTAMSRGHAFLACLVACILMLCSCGGSSGDGLPVHTTQAQAAQTGTGATGATFSQPSEVKMPVIGTSGSTPIDISHVNDGYVCVQAKNDKRLKFQMSNGDATYNFDLANDGTPCVYPINMGDGAYRFRIMQNTDGSNYIEIDATEATVKLTSEFAPFLIPNMYTDYTPSSACVAKAKELTANATNEGEAVQAICTFVIDNVTYDTAKAEKLSTTAGYVPDPDSTLSTKKGVCFDYASLGAAMLRSQGIPTKIITGYVSPGDLYHAWIMTYVDGSWQTGEFTVSPDTWSRVDLTFAAAGSSSFTGDGASYTDRYVY